MRILEQIDLSSYTTLGVGGPARYFCEPASEDEVREALDFARTRDLSLFVMGGGSNLVVSDGGWPGLAIRIAIPGLQESAAGEGKRLFHAGAGVQWDSLAEASVIRDCGGIECLSGIPGTVGGTPIQNVGAYGQEVSQTIVSVRALDMETGDSVEFSGEDCQFGYRSSRFNTWQRGRYIIVSVSFRLSAGAPPALKYPDLLRHFRDEANPTLAETREAVREIRRNKAMLIVPGDPDCRSAGSFFKNPVLESARFHELEHTAEGRGFKVPGFPSGENAVKVPAAWLVEHSGFHKGYAQGRVGISARHALAIVNRGSASAREILELKEAIQAAVVNHWGVALEPEPVFVGEFQEATAPQVQR